MIGKQHRPAFTVLEFVTVIGIIALLAGFIFVALGPSRKAARMATCSSHLRQIGLAYRMYADDWGTYSTRAPFLGAYNKDARILFCPEDDFQFPASSSYTFHTHVPPMLTPLEKASELPTSMVLLHCTHHLGRRQDDGRTPAPYPFHLVLRADGRVNRVHISRLRDVPTGDGVWLTTLYPGEPGYDQAGG